MRILAIINGEYGKRHRDHIMRQGPAEWRIETWQAPTILPPVIDYPEEYLPASFPAVDLILSFAELKGVAELLPDIAEMSGAKAVLVAVDSEAWLPKGLARQLAGWLAEIQVAYAMPKPLCSLTETDYAVALKKRVSYDSPEIREFAHYFGQPDLQVTVDATTQTIAKTAVLRDAVCGCAGYVADHLIGSAVDEAIEKAGLLHHHFPCLASMQKIDDYNHDTLMHASGHLLQDNIADQIKPFQNNRYFTPGTRSD